MKVRPKGGNSWREDERGRKTIGEMLLLLYIVVVIVIII